MVRHVRVCGWHWLLVSQCIPLGPTQDGHWLTSSQCHPTAKNEVDGPLEAIPHSLDTPSDD
ncbi:MAG: hypothetical protein ABIK89_16490 [Planctomycetota bacterium]